MPGVEQYKEIIKPEKSKAWPEGMPPVVVFDLAEGPDGPGLYVADGFMRTTACSELGRRFTKAEVRPGTWEDARAYAQGANMQHGYRLTREEIWANIGRALEDGCTVTQAAKRCQVTRNTVYAYQDRQNGKSKGKEDATAIDEQNSHVVVADPCANCKNTKYEDTPDGYKCTQCGTPENAQPVPESDFEDVLEAEDDDTTKHCDKAEAARRTLLRELDDLGLYKQFEEPMLAIKEAIEKARP